MNILTAVRNLSFVAKLFAAAKLDLNAMIDTGDETALAAHIEAASKVIAPAAPVAITAEHPEVAALIKSATDALTARYQTEFFDDLTAMNKGLVDAGVKFEKSSAKGKTVDDIAACVTTAVNNRISIKAREILATHGVTEFATDLPDSDPEALEKSKIKASGLTGLARVQAAYAAESAK